MNPAELKQYINCRMYPDERPRDDDLVIVTIRELQPELGVVVTLDEYEDCEGTIYLSELTRRKRIRSLAKLCPVGQTVVALVIQSKPEFISLSLKHVTAEDKEEYLKYYSLGKRFHGVLRKIAIKQQTPIIELYESIGWPLYRKIIDLEKLGDRIEKHPYNILAQKELIPDLDFDKELQDILLENHLDLFGEQNYKESFTVHLLSYGMNGVDDIKSNLQKCLDEQPNYPETTLDITMDECPKYEFKFSGTDKDQISAYMAKCKEILQCFKQLGFYQ